MAFGTAVFGRPGRAALRRDGQVDPKRRCAVPPYHGNGESSRFFTQLNSTAAWGSATNSAENCIFFDLFCTKFGLIRLSLDHFRLSEVHTVSGEIAVVSVNPKTWRMVLSRGRPSCENDAATAIPPLLGGKKKLRAHARLCRDRMRLPSPCAYGLLCNLAGKRWYTKG